MGKDKEGNAFLYKKDRLPDGAMWDGNDQTVAVLSERTEKHKCGRCWRLLPEVADDGDLCDRCEGMVNG
jgi:hypothetical protein